MKKKFLPLLLAVAMALLLLPVEAWAVRTGGNLSLGSNTLNDSEISNCSYYFTPSAGGTYRFYSVGNDDWLAQLYNEATDEGIDDVDYGNFSIESALEAGTRYTLYVTYYGQQGNPVIYVEKEDGDDTGESFPALTLGENTLATTGNPSSYTFTPEESGNYSFYSVGEWDTVASVSS